MHDANETHRGRSRAEALYAGYLARLEGGQPEDFESLLRQHPAEAAELRALHAGWGALDARLADLGRALDAADGHGLSPQQRVAGFRLLRRIGRGAMGEVWEAEELALGRRVALKLLLPSRLTPRGVQFFEREARAGAKVRHPGIVAVHAAGRAGGLLWIAQEHVEGERTLAQLFDELRAEPRPTAGHFRRIAELFRELARALAAAHEAGVLHRDLKPRNVLLDPEGRPKVADFGLARILDEQSLSSSGDVVGTYAYISPEQLSATKRELGPPSDVFSLGVVLYEALSRTRPFEAETTTALAARVLHHDPPDPRALEPEVPRDLAVICMKAIEKSPAQRFQSMRELEAELERFLEHRPIRTRPPGPFGRAQRWLRRHPNAAALAGLVMAAAVVTGALVRENAAARDENAQRLREERLLLAQLAGGYGDLAAAQAAARRAQALDPEDPLAHLVLAWSHSRLGQFDEVGRELRAAVEKGFDPLASEPATPMARLARGLYHLCRGGPEDLVAAEPELAAAIEGDPRLGAAGYALYVARLGLGDVEGARAALETLARLRLSAPEAALVRALALELEGQPEEAAAVLREADPEALRELRAERVLGRLLLQAGDPEGAALALRVAVADLPRDEPSWVNLALALRLAPAPEDAGEAAARWNEIEAACERALDSAPHHVEARVLLGLVALDRLEADFEHVGPPPGPGWDELDRRIAELAAAAPAHPALAELESHRLALVADVDARSGEFERARAGFEAAVERDPENLRARVRLAQELALGAEADAREEPGPWRSAQDQLEQALASWERAEASPAPSPERPSVGRRWPRGWYQAAQVWSFFVAVRLGEPARAADARAAVEAELARGEELAFEELATFVEALATSEAPLKDCARALELIAEHDLRARLAEVAGGPELLAQIDAACP